MEWIVQLSDDVTWDRSKSWFIDILYLAHKTQFAAQLAYWCGSRYCLLKC